SGVSDEQSFAGRALVQLHGRRVSRVDFDRVKHVISQHTVNAEQASESNAPGQAFSEYSESILDERRKSQRADRAGVLELAGNVKPIDADDLARGADQTRPTVSPAIHRGDRIALNPLLNVPAVSIEVFIRSPWANVQPARATPRLEQPARARLSSVIIEP